MKLQTYADAATSRRPELIGQTVVVIGGTAGIGLETARLARAGGADVVLTGRDPGTWLTAVTSPPASPAGPGSATPA
jgi:NAD(P)-dependent dehydrogenase (short-subunit alcohol dehydrogenase family)